jgi:tetratricopeptide (TPR) repeat protein
MTTDATGDDLAQWARSLHRGQRLRHPRLREAAGLVAAGHHEHAAKLLREFLKQRPQSAAALHLLAETVEKNGDTSEAEELFARCLELEPGFAAARFAYVKVLLKSDKPEKALAELDALLDREPRNPLFRERKAMALEGLQHHAHSAALWRELLDEYPARPEWWLHYGHSLRGVGQLEETIAAYRRAIALDPKSGLAWWSLADLKTFRFSAADIAQMESLLARDDIATAGRVRLHFALGKAHADLSRHAESFAHYAKANAMQRVGAKHDPTHLTAYVARSVCIFTRDFFRERVGFGTERADPIFIVGMPRSGSTLVEQILASHSEIEGTREFFTLAGMAKRLLAELAPRERNGYPGVLEKLDAAACACLGHAYLDAAQVHRRLGRRFFTDKMGANYVHVGMIQLILPNARIIDVRRHPLDCCVSNFVQLFPKGQEESYRLADIGRAWRDYVELMAHFDCVLPGKIQRVFYERLVAEPQSEIRRMLEYLVLPFQDSCLRFHETKRVVTTISSQQVRNPVYGDAVERWRNYEPWLAPLKAALGPVLDTYPNVPEFS